MNDLLFMVTIKKGDAADVLNIVFMKQVDFTLLIGKMKLR